MRVNAEVGHTVNVNNSNTSKKAMSLNVDLMFKSQLKLFLIERGMTVSNYSVHQLRELAKKVIDLKLPVIKISG